MGTAGGSACREYERRLASHGGAVKRTLPVLAIVLAVTLPTIWIAVDRFAPRYGLGGVAALAVGLWLVRQLWPSRAHVDAWAKGAAGEQKTARALQRLGAAFNVFHHRRIPGRRANIDHIVVGPTGIFIVETKNVGGKVTVRDGELFVAGRRRQTYVEQAWREAGAVQSALSDITGRSGIDVQPLLCFHRAELPWGKTTASGVPLSVGGAHKAFAGRAHTTGARPGRRDIGRDQSPSRFLTGLRCPPCGALRG